MERGNELDETFYEIQVKGRLDERRGEFFDGMVVASQDDVTTMSGERRTRPLRKAGRREILPKSPADPSVSHRTPPDKAADDDIVSIEGDEERLALDEPRAT